MRLNIGTLLVGIFAILFGLIGAYALRAALSPKPVPPVAGPRTLSVPMASNDLPVGRRIVLSDMVIVPLTAEQMKEKNYPLETLMISTDQIIGRLLKEPLKQGDVFLTNKLYREGEGPTVEEKLAPGFRAFTIPMDDLSAVGGAATAGSLIDVVFRLAAQPGDPIRNIPPLAETTVTLVENVEILAVNREITMARPQGQGLDIRTNVNRKPEPIIGPIRSVTLAVTPDQANILKTAMGRGEMVLRLRAAHETASAQTLGPLTIEKLIGLKQVDGKQKRPNRMEIYRAGGLQVLPYDDDNYFPGTGGVNGGYQATTGWAGWNGGLGMGGWGANAWAGNGWGGGGWGGGWGSMNGSQAAGGGLRYYPGGFGGASGYSGNYMGFGGGGGGLTPTQTILPYPGLPPRAGSPDSMYFPNPMNNFGPGNFGPNQAPTNNGPFPGQNAGGAQVGMPVAVNWTMPYGSSYAYMGPYYSYPFAPPYIPAIVQ